MTSFARPALFVCALLLLGSGSGCGRIERTSQCKALATTVNPRVDELEKLATGPKTPQAYAKLSAGYASLADEVSKLPIAQHVTVAPDVKAYVEALRSAAKSCQAYGAALDGDTSRLDSLDRELERVTRREKMAAAKLGAYCSL